MRVIVFLLFVLIHISSLAQSASNPDSGIKKNAIYLSAERFLLVGANLSYERNLFNPDITFIRFINARVSYGWWLSIAAGGSNYAFTLHSISGLNNHHIEGVLGLSIYVDCKGYNRELCKNDDVSIKKYILPLPQVGLGYRYQKPDGHIIFRTCVGIPFVQCSFGVAF
jgi:hypothetical protein